MTFSKGPLPKDLYIYSLFNDRENELNLLA